MDFLGEKEVILIDEDMFSPNAKIRKVWIPKQYLTYGNDLVVKMKVSAARETRKKWNVSIPSI